MKIKNVLKLLVCVFINTILSAQSAQNGTGILVVNNDLMKGGQLSSSQLGFLNSRLKSSTIFSNRYNGTPFLFDNWNKKATVYIKGKSYAVNNVNYNIQEDRFFTKIDTDSLLVFDFRHIDKIVVDNREFVDLYNNDKRENNIYEVIFRNKEFNILKAFSISLTEPKQAPGAGIAKPNIAKTIKYFYYSNKKMKPLRINKKSVLKLVGANNEAKLLRYIKANKLSYRKERDLKKMLAFILND